MRFGFVTLYRLEIFLSYSICFAAASSADFVGRGNIVEEGFVSLGYQNALFYLMQLTKCSDQRERLRNHRYPWLYFLCLQIYTQER